jgi:hypothetical protein
MKPKNFPRDCLSLVYAMSLLPHMSSTYSGLSCLLGISEKSVKRIVKHAVENELVKLDIPAKAGTGSKVIVKLGWRAQIMVFSLIKGAEYYARLS